MYDFLSGDPHPVTVSARTKLDAEGESLSTEARANRVKAIKRAQEAAVAVERREARSREFKRQLKAIEEMREMQRKPFAAMRMAEQQQRERSKREHVGR